ncbi:MAG: hypothetical protein A2Y40_04195 [Candidatus Margulisbacteria bacterium GWF2_35_9]|nr:MAG: hypothetical protein A2Y40_04195 [Candidatus Margulisbacteria bacterium GWF2_35_9]
MQFIQFIRANLFLIEILIVCGLFGTYYILETKVHPVKRIINGLLLVLIFGIPIFFTSATRSVFEVNKLLLLRVTTTLSIVFICIRALLVDYDKKNEDAIYKNRDYYEVFGVKWYKTGIEIPIVIWLIVNVISTLISQNLYVSIIGAYDRWEGLITVFNYTILFLLFTKIVDNIRFFYWIFYSFITSASISAIYGIAQSNGFDFMQWSADATKRAFGSINNPVHYGPYIGMMILLVFGYMIQIKYFQNKMPKIRYHLLFLVSIILTLIIYYAMFTSWGRGTWLGFQGALTFFLLFITKLFVTKNKKLFFIDVLATMAMVAVFYITFLFRVYKANPVMVFSIVALIFALYAIWVISQKRIINLVERFVIVYMAFSIQLISADPKYFYIYMVFLIVLMVIHIYMSKQESIFLQNKWIVYILFCFGFLLLAPTVVDFLIVLVFSTLFYSISIINKELKDKPIAIFVPLVFILIIAFFLIPKLSLYTKIMDASHSREKNMNVLKMARSKVSSYATEATGEYSPRISMWKSGITWGLKNPLFGTGPDTIKEMYPYYRRVEYARREGGHNLTPDRLHNEYVNTFATTGFLGIIGRYILVIGIYGYLVIGYLYKNLKKPSYYLILSTFCGFLFYQGQVLFNFGVVATASLTYQLMGLGLAIGYYGFGNSYEGK